MGPDIKHRGPLKVRGGVLKIFLPYEFKSFLLNHSKTIEKSARGSGILRITKRGGLSALFALSSPKEPLDVFSLKILDLHVGAPTDKSSEINSHVT